MCWGEVGKAGAGDDASISMSSPLSSFSKSLCWLAPRLGADTARELWPSSSSSS